MDYNLPKLPIREENSNKGTFGKVLNISGSEFMPGAAYLSSVASLKVGAGYVKLLSNENTLKTVSSLAPEIVLEKYLLKTYPINQYNVILFGCGCGTDSIAKDYLEFIVKNRKNIPTIIDADGLNVLAENYYKFDKNVILTPHPKEASRLLNCSLDEVLADTEKAVKAISDKYNCIAALKTHKTVVTDGKSFYTNNTGCSALAKAGSGDVLAGMISGLAAQGMKPFDAVVLGVYLHGLTGDMAAKDLSEYGVLASDLLRYIPFTIKKYLDTFK